MRVFHPSSWDLHDTKSIGKVSFVKVGNLPVVCSAYCKHNSLCQQRVKQVFVFIQLPTAAAVNNQAID